MQKMLQCMEESLEENKELDCLACGRGYCV